MSKLRVGTITYIDSEKQLGVIVDENAQDITFSMEFVNGFVKVDDQVSFEITLEDGLKAVNISIL
ncbi:hypothetical protein ASE92_09510 [Pedobacter sp. Leaf41]|jgi:hypothetical protein|uniref:hypothetical protein n=1 Tax=Pedobacter sp. Leaf41 TaxID=1736218 RepID=UPI0007038792|nr:hypothetical protein [Pedobacter sp. Leaf41]KQN36340.1 hypothetical protein ASE92_09510 [Pedobacter sp. Leaf41]